MDIKKISDESGKLIEYLNNSKLKPDEKIAALKTAAATIETVISCEIVTVMMARALLNQGK